MDIHVPILFIDTIQMKSFLYYQELVTIFIERIPLFPIHVLYIFNIWKFPKDSLWELSKRYVHMLEKPNYPETRGRGTGTLVYLDIYRLLCPLGVKFIFLRNILHLPKILCENRFFLLYSRVVICRIYVLMP